ncbi:MAG: septum formation inhibitor [Bacteroidales bacterium]|nr:septum formation inhibitor [Bacteroidales bacterium]
MDKAEKKNNWQVLFRLVRNKYISASLIFVVWVGLFDENNLIERFKLIRQLRRLENDKEYYLKQIEKDAARLKELQTNNENLEKFAREQYLMHRKNEEVFVIVRE